MYTIRAASHYLGVSMPTLRRWDRLGRLVPFRTIGGHRRYSLDALQQFYGIYEEDSDTFNNENTRIPILYARVSSSEQQQKGNLDRQIDHLKTALFKRYGPNHPYKIIQEYGSGLNADRKGLLRLIHAVCENKINQIYITYGDRLTRFGYKFLELLFAEHGAKIIITDQSPSKPIESQLVDDMMSLIACLSGKLYKSRALKASAEFLNEANKEDHHISSPNKESILEHRWITRKINQAIHNAVIRILHSHLPKFHSQN